MTVESIGLFNYFFYVPTTVLNDFYDLPTWVNHRSYQTPAYRKINGNWA